MSPTAGTGVTLAVGAAAAALHGAAWTEWGRRELWGLHHLAWAPRPAAAGGLALLLVALCPPVAGRLVACLRAGAARAALPPRAAPAALAALGLCLFLAFPVTHPLLGDAPGRLAEIEAPSLPGWFLPHGSDAAVRHAVHHTLGSWLGWPAVRTYAVLSAAWGVVFLLAAWTAASQLLRPGEGGAARLALLAPVATSGFVLLFFGYVEVYSSAAALDLVFLAAVLRYARGRGALWQPLLALAVLAYHHVLGPLPAPALAVAIARRRGWDRRLGAVGRRLALWTTAAGAAGGWAAFQVVRPTSAVPLWHDQPHIPYRLFDAGHLADVANFSLLAALPAWVALVAAGLTRPGRGRPGDDDPALAPLWVAAGTSAAVMFVVNPALGRLDWDLMAMHAPLWVLAGAAALLARLRRCGADPAPAALALGLLGLFHTVPWVALQRSPPRAAAAIEAMVADDPHQAGGRALKLGVRFEDLGFDAAALRQYQRAAEWDSADGLNFYNLGRLYDKRGDLDRAVAYYQRAVELGPGFAKAHNNLGGAYLRLRRLPEAVAAFQLACRLDPGLAAAYANLGGALYDLGRLADAASAYGEAARLEPQMFHAHFNEGVAWVRLDSFAKAAAAFERYVALRPDAADGYLQLGDACARGGDRPCARGALARYLELAPATDPMRERALAYLRGTDPGAGAPGTGGR